VLILIAASCAPTTIQRGPIAEWREPRGAEPTGPSCAAPPAGAAAVLRARLTPLERIVESGQPASARIEAVRALEPAFAEFRVAEVAACRLLEADRITVSEYDAFLDSVAVFLPYVDAAGLPGTPEPVAPDEGAVFDVYPRTTTLEWAPVAGAAGYLVEIQGRVATADAGDDTPRSVEWVPERGGLHAYEVTGTGLRFDFVGAQPGRWRVRALDTLGRAGPASPWRHFSHTR
jgi:hypothetical protein